MTMPRISSTMNRVSDMVREMVPFLRRAQSPQEIELALHLRGNVALYNALIAIIDLRIRGRAGVPEPSDPVLCKSMLARDRELQWLRDALERAYRAPALTDEHPDE